MVSVRARRWIRVAAPLFAALVAFLAVEYGLDRRAADRAALDPVLEWPIRHLDLVDVELQVAVHDLVERAPEGSAVRVCRMLATRHVTVNVDAPAPMRAVLDDLARQAGASLVLGVGRADTRVLPTIPCPGNGPRDYLIIGGDEPGPH